MTYRDGSPVTLGDIVTVPLQDGSAKARVVMLGDTQEHLGLDERFVQWVQIERLLETAHVVIEWIGHNPLAHDDPKYAPVGNYMFTGLDSCIAHDVR